MKGILKGVISVFLVVGLMITIGSCKAPSGVAETEVATTSGVTETTEAKKEPEIGEVKVIRFVTPETDPAVVELFRKQISEYEELHPDVKVQLELVPLANLGSYYGPNIAGGNVPEVGGCIGGLLVEYLGMDILEPLDDVIAEMGGEEAFYKGSLIKGSDGKIYNLPYCGGGPVFWVREDLFEQYGVKIPTNWNEWLEAAKALTLDTNNDGQIDIYGTIFCAGKSDLTEILVAILTWQQGKTLWDANMMPTFNTPEVINAFKFIKELSQYCPPGIMEYSYYDMMDPFGAKRVASTIYWGRLLQFCDTNAPDLLPVMKAVPIPVNPDHNIKVTYADYDFYIVFKNSKHPEVGKDFAKFLVTGDRIAEFMKVGKGHFLPCTKENAEIESFWNDEFVKANEENIKVCFDVPNYGLWLFLNEAGAEYKDGKWEIIEDMVNTNIGKTWPQFVVGTALQKYLTGQETAEKAVEWAQKEMERIIQESEEEK